MARPATARHAAIDLPLRRVAAVVVGNALEFYDFLTFTFFAVQIGHCFFPAGATRYGLLYTLATFGVGFLARPVGGIVIGRYGDRAGRKPAMVLSFTLMGAGIIGLSLTPSYASIGIAAPVLLVIFRLIQGFALGGEVGPSTAFLVEAAPPHRRGLYLSLQVTTQYLAVLAAGLMGFVLASVLTPQALDGWGWRVAFLIGAAIVPFGIAMRRGLPETLTHDDAVPASAHAMGMSPGLIVACLLILGAGAIGDYGLVYIGVYAQDTLHLLATVGFGAIIVIGVVGVVGSVMAGLVADRFGRKRVFVTAAAAQCVLALPAYLAMNRAPYPVTIYASIAVLAAFEVAVDVAGLLMVSESLPKRMRSGSLSIIYALALACFGGSMQFVAKALLELTGNSLAPAGYVTVALAVCAIAALRMRETSPRHG